MNSDTNSSDHLDSIDRRPAQLVTIKSGKQKTTKKYQILKGQL